MLRFEGQRDVARPPGRSARTAARCSGATPRTASTRRSRAPLDLTGATNPVLTFKTWYDIERWYDWGYVSVSTDGGATWEALPGDQTTTDDPVLAAYGPGYSGKSGGGRESAWVDERVSLAKFAGTKILLRFEYVTDGATHGPGLGDRATSRVEGASISDPGFTDPGWSSDGWVRIDRQLAADVRRAR